MPNPSARHDNKHLAVLFALSKLLNWAVNNPLQAMLALLAMQAVAGVSRSTRETRDITPEIKDITESFSSYGLELEAKETHFAVQDITEAYRARRLQAEQTCESSIELPDSGNAWALTLGGVNDDYGNQVAIGNDGSIVLTGYTRSFGAVDYDVLLARFTADGALSWARTFGGWSFDFGNSIALKPDGSIVLVGYTESFGAGYGDVLLAQFTGNGTLSWIMTLGGSNYDAGTSLALKPDGSMVLTGYTSSFGAGRSDVLLAQFTANGTLSWARAFGGASDEHGNTLALKPDGSVVLTGYTSSFGAGGLDVLLAQFTEDGTLSWARTFGGSYWDVGNSLALKPDGSIVLTGYTSGFDVGSTDVLLAQFAADGVLSWARTLGGSRDDVGNSLALKSDGSIVLMGSTPSFGAGGTDVLLAQYTENGTLSWAWTLGGSNSDYGNSLALKPDGSIVLTGSTASFGAGSSDVLLTVLSPSNTIPLLFRAVSFQAIQAPDYSHALPSNIISSLINPTIMNISSLLIQNTSISLALSPISESAITPLSLFPIQNAWQQPKNALPTFKYTYALPTTFLRYMAVQPSLNIDLQGSDWLNYDVNLKTISGTPINSFNKETQIIINPDAVVAAGGSVYYGQLVVKLCIGLEEGLFIKSLGGSRDDAGNSLALKPDGSIVLTGTTQNFGAGLNDVLLAQFTADGALSWALAFGGSSDDVGNTLALKPDGSIVLMGYTASFGAGYYDVLLAQFTENGSLSWARTLGGSSDDVGNTLALKPDGSIVLTGYTESFGAGYGDVLLAQFTENGSLSWVKTLGGSNYDAGTSLALKPDGSIVLTGYTSSFGAGGDDVLLVQFTADGALSWARTLGGSSYDEGDSLALKPDGSIVLTGWYTGSFGAGGVDVLLAQFTADGALSWARTFGGSNNDKGKSLALKPGGSLVLTGYTSSFGAGGLDVLLAQFTADGDLSWARTLGGISDDVGSNLALKPDGSIVLTGNTLSFGAGSADVLLTQLNAMGETRYDNYLIQSISTAQSTSINPLIINITNSIEIAALSVSAENWNTTQKFTINPSAYNVFPYLKYILSPVQNQPFNQTYSLSINSLLGYDIALLRLTEWNKATLPAWLRYNPTSMLLSGTPTGKVRGNYYINMNLQHSGKQQEITFIINVLNTPPYYVGNATLTTSTGRFLFPLAEFFKDNEADAIYPYAIAELNGQLAPTIASIDATSGRLFGTALSGEQGNYHFNITALDSFSKLGWQLITIQVVNSAPMANVIFSNPAPVTVGNLFSFSFDRNAFIDPDGDAISYSAIYPSFLNFDANTRTLYGTPQARDRGLHGLVIMARDGYGGQGNVSLVMDVNGIPFRQFDLPTLVSMPVGQPYAYTLPSGLFTDPDNDFITYALIRDLQFNPPSWLNFNSSSQALYGTPIGNSHQAIPLRFVVSDGRGGQSYYDVSLSTPNSAPLAYSLTSQTVAVGQARSLLIPSDTFIDPDADKLIYSLESISGNTQSWLSLADQVITFFPKSGNQGQYRLKLMAKDGFGGEAALNFSVIVPNNVPKLMYAIPTPLVASANNPWSFLLDADNFADSDSDPLIYTAKSLNGSLPDWINFNPSRRLFTGTPSGRDRGLATLVVGVDDDFGGKAQGYFNLTVVNSAPQPEGRIFDQQVSKLETGFVFTVPSFVDADGDGVSYSAEMVDGTALPAWLSFDATTRTFSASPIDVPAGNYLINVIATDSLGLNAKVGFNLAIQTPPTINLGTSTTELAKNIAPFVAAGTLVLVIAGMLIWRERRIKAIRERIIQWSRALQTKEGLKATGQIEFSALSRAIEDMGRQLTEGAIITEIDLSLQQLEQQLRLYYGQAGALKPMTALLNSQIVPKLIHFVETNLLEINYRHYDNQHTLDAVRLLHGFLRIVLSEHTGRGNKLLLKTKEQYVNALNDLLAKAMQSKRGNIAIRHELESAREALICINDTTTLRLLCLASATHILSPGALLGDLRKLAFDIPSTWYVTLLEQKIRVPKAKSVINVLTHIQSVAAKHLDWRFRYGMISILIEIMKGTTNPAIRSQAFNGSDSPFAIQLLGFIHLLKGCNSGLQCQKNTSIRQLACLALSEASIDFAIAEKQKLLPFMSAKSMLPKLKVKVIKNPLASVDLAEEAKAMATRAIKAHTSNPLLNPSSVMQNAPIVTTRPVTDDGSGARRLSMPTTVRVANRASILATSVSPAATVKKPEVHDSGTKTDSPIRP